MARWYTCGSHLNVAQIALLSMAVMMGLQDSAKAAPSLTEQLHKPPQNEIRAQRDVADQFLLVGRSQLRSGDHGQAIAALDEAANAYHYLGDFVGMGEAYEQLVKAYSELGRYREAETVVRKQLAIAHSNNNFSDQILAYNNLGTLSLQEGDLATARAAFDEGLTVSQDIGSQSGIGLSLSNLGLISAAQGKMDDAAKYYEIAADYRARARDYAGQANTDSNLGDIYLATGRLREAVGAYRHSLSLARDVDAPYIQLRAIDGLISAYRQIKLPREVEQYLAERITLTLRTGDDWQRLITFRTMGEIYEENGDLTAAYESYQRALRIAVGLNQKSVQADLSNRVRSLSLRLVD